MPKLERHFFVCQTQRPPMAKPSCGPRGSAELLNALNEGLANHPELWGKVAVTACGCLGPCFDGPSIVVYPEGVWYQGLKLNQLQEVIDAHMVGGKPVDSLVYKWPD